jgi:ABC transport system ATP-binding/permease protein
MPPPLLLLQDIDLTFGVTPLLSGAEFAVAAGERVCLVGRNGSGKSTLVRIAAGLVQPDAGYRFAQPGATIHYLPQEPDLSGFTNTLSYVEAGFSAEAADGRPRALYLLKELGLSGEEDLASLSGGEARRAALARALAPLPDILLLDEAKGYSRCRMEGGKVRKRRCAPRSRVRITLCWSKRDSNFRSLPQ